MPKAEFIKIFRYLDKLRSSGITNMYGAPAYLIREYGLTEKQATMFWNVWVDTFDLDLSVETRVQTAYNTQD